MLKLTSLVCITNCSQIHLIARILPSLTTLLSFHFLTITIISLTILKPFLTILTTTQFTTLNLMVTHHHNQCSLVSSSSPLTLSLTPSVGGPWSGGRAP